MNKTEAKILLDKYANGKCTEEELAILHTWYLEQEVIDFDISAEEVEAAKEKIWNNLPVHQEVATKTIKLFPSILIKRIAVAAAVVLSVSLGYYVTQKDKLKSVYETAKLEQIVPGGNKATLTLADGSKIDLNKMSNGILGDENGTRIVKTDDGKIFYNHDEAAKTVAWNTLNIPAGGYYNVTLSDGTIVWLNSKSSLKYPTAFIGKERVVELTGEGYFEVAHKENQPFKVITEQQTVEVLGTHFNINAYSDEQSTTTTLLEGSVRINAAGNQKLLSPNNQAKLISGNIMVRLFDAENAIDWVSNDFFFDDEDLGSITRQLSRWYDVEFSYPTNLAELKFSGRISRNINIKQVLKIMELTKMVNFKVEGRRITVTP
ncbi:MAG: FecR family protein [Pedobacter sp.]|uniref:FecR family protein n=1 Tax=Pedobacter sp. TaxID=1411316 RepID=UPI002809C50B|nr:FecR family protein [Pedobacter sp.]MDQ8005171.1 FecR family protein [Pedobacter sp.]